MSEVEIRIKLILKYYVIITLYFNIISESHLQVSQKIFEFVDNAGLVSFHRNQVITDIFPPNQYPVLLLISERVPMSRMDNNKSP